MKRQGKVSFVSEDGRRMRKKWVIRREKVKVQEAVCLGVRKSIKKELWDAIFNYTFRFISFSWENSLLVLKISAKSPEIIVRVVFGILLRAYL